MTKASILGIAANLFLMFIKGVVGFTTHSQAMIADFFNSAGDIFSSFMTFIGSRIASKPNDEDHHLGHGKAEYIYALLISIVMAFSAILIFRDAILSLFSPSTYQFSKWLIVVCIFTILIKLGLYFYTKRLAQKLNSVLLKANAKDHRNDCIMTFTNLIASCLALGGYSYFDSISGAFISGWIFWTSLTIFKESYDVLMDKSINLETQKKVLSIVLLHDEVKKVTHFNSTPVGYRYQLSFSIFVDGNLSTFESHEIANHLEKEIVAKIPEIYLVVIHVNPI